MLVNIMLNAAVSHRDVKMLVNIMLNAAVSHRDVKMLDGPIQDASNPSMCPL